MEQDEQLQAILGLIEGMRGRMMPGPEAHTQVVESGRAGQQEALRGIGEARKLTPASRAGLSRQVRQTGQRDVMGGLRELKGKEGAVEGMLAQMAIGAREGAANRAAALQQTKLKADLDWQNALRMDRRQRRKNRWSKWGTVFSGLSEMGKPGYKSTLGADPTTTEMLMDMMREESFGKERDRRLGLAGSIWGALGK